MSCTSNMARWACSCGCLALCSSRMQEQRQMKKNKTQYQLMQQCCAYLSSWSLV
jgi:hypothetical protein